MSTPVRAPIELVLTSLPIERVESGVAVAGFFTDERPLRGGAARADWRLCGGLSRRIEQGELSGRSGEAMLIGSHRALRSPRLLLLGLGERSRYDRLRVTDETRGALERCAQLGVSNVALAPLGIAADDVPRHAASVVAAVAGAWAKSSEPRRLLFCVPRSELAAVLRAFESACDTEGRTAIRVGTDEDGSEAG